MAKPILYLKHAFDANYNTTFNYEYLGDQQFSNKLIIRDIDANIVYNQVQTTFRLEHTVSAGILQNGKFYTAEVIVYNKLNAASETSDRIQFKTFTTPIFNIANLIQNQIIRNSNYQLEIYYDQIEGELLNEFQIELFDLSHQKISSSGMLLPINGMTYTLTSLLDNQNYFIKLTGVTVNKMELQTEEIEFSVEYTRPAIYSKLSLENLQSQATIKLQSNLILIDGNPSHEPVIYIDNDKVDLTKDGKYVIYDEGFIIEKDFLLEIIAENIPRNKTFFEISDKSGNKNIIIQKWFGNIFGYDGIKEYFVLHVTNGTLTYRIVSNILNVLENNQQVILIIKRIGNLYSMIAKLYDKRDLDGGNPFAEYYPSLDYHIDGGNPEDEFNLGIDIEIDGEGEE